MNEFIHTLYQQLEEELALYADLSTVPVNKLNGAMNSIRLSMEKLKNYVLGNAFQSEQEEISFFKYDKSKFVSEMVFLRELTAVQIKLPVFGADAIRTFYEAQLRQIECFFTQYRFFYEYYRLDADDLDPLLFLRKSRPLNILLPGSGEQDDQFSTNGDFLFGKFIAFERLQTYLIDEINSVSNTYQKRGMEDENKSKSLTWTGESINLVELAYGMWLTGQVDHGNASISEIIQWLEVHFNVRIGKAHRRWQAVAARKRVSQVKYIDEIRAAVLKRIDDENGR